MTYLDDVGYSLVFRLDEKIKQFNTYCQADGGFDEPAVGTVGPLLGEFEVEDFCKRIKVSHRQFDVVRDMLGGDDSKEMFNAEARLEETFEIRLKDFDC